MAARLTYQTRDDAAADMWIPGQPAAAADTAQPEAWAPDETGDAIDFLASIDRHNLEHDDAWEL